MEETFENSNLYFVASAVSYGSRVERTERREDRIFFHLSNCPSHVWTIVNGRIEPEEVKDFKTLFYLYNSRCLMHLPSYPNSLKDMKALLYDR